MFLKYTLATNDYGEENCIIILSPHKFGMRRSMGRGKDYVVEVFDEGGGHQLATITHFYDNHGEGKIPTEKLIPAEGYTPIFIENAELYNRDGATQIGSHYFKLLESQDNYLIMAVWEDEKWVVDFNCLAYDLSYMEIYNALDCEAFVFNGYEII